MATTTNYGWETPDDTDLVKDGAAAMRTLGQSIDTSFVDLKGGTTGQVLSKASGTDLDFTWVAQDDSNAIQNAIVDAKGDLIAATAADTPARLAVGTNGQVLTADSAEATGLKWATPASTSKFGQIVSTFKSDSFTAAASSTWTDITGMSVSITPTASTSKVYVQLTLTGDGNFGDSSMAVKLLRGSTDIALGDSAGSRIQSTVGSYTAGTNSVNSMVINYLDSPATTSATTYKVQGIALGGSNIYVNRSKGDVNSSAYARYVSSITVTEILA